MSTDKELIDTYLEYIDPEKRDALKTYYDNLLHFNSRVNLISSSTVATTSKHHFADSALGLQLILGDAEIRGDVYDFGSGNGFPGIILAVLEPNLNVILVEKDQRKVEFLKYVVSELQLKNAGVYPKQMETLPKDSIHLGVTRAMSSISKMIIQANSLFKDKSTLYHFKSDNWASELAQCPTQVFTRWDIQPVGQYMLPDSSIERFIIASKRI